MRCWSETMIERAAIRLGASGFRPGRASAAAVPGDLEEFLVHTADCVRCRELLDLFLDTESLFRASFPDLPLVLPLRPLRPAPGPPVEAGSGYAESYPLAARSIDRDQDEGERPPATRILTLTTEDERLVVRIFPNESGNGATAVLHPLRPNVILRIGGSEYRFDASGWAQLPDFPSDPISLVLG